MKKRVMPIMAMALMAAAAEANDQYFMTMRRYRQQRDDAIRQRREDEVVKRTIINESQKENEFSIHGEKIMAKNRKTAMKIYANRHPESKKRKK